MPISDRIKNVVVLMLENRSFDHMLGYLRRPDYLIDGLLGTEFNFADPTRADSRKCLVSDDAPFVPDIRPDPGHGFPNVQMQLFGSGAATGEPAMSGFVKDYLDVSKVPTEQARDIMRCYAPKRVPVIATLAESFAICERWFSSVPGPTWPNRFFAHCATSNGTVDNEYSSFPMRTIQENLTDRNVSWRDYWHDVPQTMLCTNLRNMRYAKYFEAIDAFFRDCQNGTLPQYSFIEPAYFNFVGTPANDQHPEHGILLGERLIADVYNALRSSPQWNTSLLLVVWDEHGGFYDHVAPPKTVNPDGKVAQNGFDFTRLGCRVPAVAVSPWIPMHTIDTTLYDHASIAASLKELFGLPDYLTNRDRNANTFMHLCSLDAARTDAPTNLKPASAPIEFVSKILAEIASKFRGPNALQLDLLRALGQIAPGAGSAQNNIATEEQAARYARDATKRALSGA